jgi:putative transposase
MLVIAGSTSKELARQVSYLKAENQILRSRLPERLILTHREKNRLVRFAKNLGSALNELATIVHPSTIRRWIRDLPGRNPLRNNTPLQMPSEHESRQALRSI